MWKFKFTQLLAGKLIIMENNKILSATFLDILFDGRNKEYGAYQLRKSYNKRITTALVVTGSFILLVFLGSVLANALDKKTNSVLVVDDTVNLTEVKIPDRIEPPVIPPPKQITAPPPVEMKQFTPPVIMQDDKVKDDEKPPENADLADVIIGTADMEGAKYDGVVAPPLEIGTGDAVAPKAPEEDYDKIFIKVENPATFPNGLEGWKRYLERNLNYPDAAQDNGTMGVVKIQMVVDKNGKISEVQALNNPGDGLAEEAIRVIKTGPDWKPAEQNGKPVAYRFVQTITFSM